MTSRSPRRPEPARPGRSGGRPPPAAPWIRAVRRFVARYGWRAYALPVLVVLTVLALATTAAPDRSRPAASPGTVHPSSSASPSRPPPSTPSPRNSPTRRPKADPRGEGNELASDALPPGAPYTLQGNGTFRVLPGTSQPVGSGPLRTYTIEVENGITGIDLTQFATTVTRTLADRRSWTGSGGVSLQRVASDANADFRVTLTSSMTVRQLCGYDQKIETSCWDDTHGPGRVNLNDARWVRGDVQFPRNLSAYHLYMINHEVGHALGHEHVYRCLPNAAAPVMMQQTITLKENQGKGPRTCAPNSWPYPPGVAAKDAVTT